MHSFIHCSLFSCCLFSSVFFVGHGWVVRSYHTLNPSRLAICQIGSKALSSEEEDLQHRERCIDKGGGSKIALLHRNRVYLILIILTQLCSLSHITYQCHFALYVRDPSLRNNTYSFKPNVQEFFSLALVSLQAKPSLKSLHQIAPPSLLPSFLPLVANNLNQISTTNHQQGRQPICILSKR